VEPVLLILPMDPACDFLQQLARFTDMLIMKVTLQEVFVPALEKALVKPSLLIEAVGCGRLKENRTPFAEVISSGLIWNGEASFDISSTPLTQSAKDGATCNLPHRRPWKNRFYKSAAHLWKKPRA
jgi:hypothetical protein